MYNQQTSCYIVQLTATYCSESAFILYVYMFMPFMIIKLDQVTFMQ